MKEKKFSFCDSLCLNSFILNSTKRNFVLKISKVIYKKISLEHILKISNGFEMFKEFILTQQEIKEFNELPILNLDMQMQQMEIAG